jgi:hypothetical protein
VSSPTERFAAKDGSTCVLELAESRIEADRKRIRPEQPIAEAVNRRDPSAVELTSKIGTATRS